MDNIGSIIDTRIRIKPSQELVKFINDIDVDQFTENIYELRKASDSLKDNCSILETNDSNSNKLLSQDIEVLNKIKKEYSQKNDIKSDKKPKEEETKPEILNNDKHKHIYLDLKDLDFILDYIVKRNASSTDKIYLHELLAKSTIVLPQNEVIKRNPILEARCEKLRAEQEARHYRSITKNVDNQRKHEPEETIAYQISQMNRQMIAVLQFIFSVAAGFVFGFIGLELMFGELDFGFRLLMGIMCALIIAIAEIYFLAKKLNEEEVIINVPTQAPKTTADDKKSVEKTMTMNENMKTKIKLNK
ncbi:uncharacterized protein LOC113366582, partial [Ctenocephalides felis]|uniref:uncharacterized protein LOC113366582 n=1 Tax=Ctenocephalides felis TaxID=7515 RepID=UPI000E6E1835